MWGRILATAIVACATLARAPPATAADEAYFRGKTVTVYVGFSPGGGYDAYARLLARHLRDHIPGAPAVVVQNMPGGGSVRLANFMYEAAPRDGTAIATLARATPFAPLTGQQGATFDASLFGWIGSMTDEVGVCIASRASGFATLDDVRAREMTLAGTTPSDDAVQVPKILNGLFGTRFRVITGYPGGADMNLATERGETQGRCGQSWTSFRTQYKSWLDADKVRVLVQIALTKAPDLQGVPLLLDLARDEEQSRILRFYSTRQAIARPFFTAPSVPAERLSILRDAFMGAMADPELLADADKAGLEINPISGEKVATLIRETYAMPREIARHVEELAGQQ